MACCRHPLAVALKRAGYADFAVTIEHIASDEESSSYRDKQDGVRAIILDHLDVSPKVADHLVEQIFRILDSGSRYMHEWPRAYKALLHSFVHVTDMPMVPQMMPKLAKLREYWSDIQNLVWAP